MSGKIIIVREQSMVMSLAVWLYAGYDKHQKKLKKINTALHTL